MYRLHSGFSPCATHLPAGPRFPMMCMVCTGVLTMWLVFKVLRGVPGNQPGLGDGAVTADQQNTTNTFCIQGYGVMWTYRYTVCLQNSTTHQCCFNYIHFNNNSLWWVTGTYTGRLSCRLCLTLAILCASKVGLDLTCVTILWECCSEYIKNSFKTLTFLLDRK